MKIFIGVVVGVWAAVLSQAQPSVKPAIDGVLSLFQEKPIVVLCDYHGLAQQEDFYSALVRDPRFAEKVVLNFATQVPRTVWKGKLIYPRSFYGFSQGGRMSAEVVREVGRSAPAGVSELMVHVGVSNDEAPGFWTGYDYAGDFRAVTTYTKQEFEKEFGVSLVTHVQGGPDGFR